MRGTTFRRSTLAVALLAAAAFTAATPRATSASGIAPLGMGTLEPTSPPQPAGILTADPVKIRIQGVAYRMTVTVTNPHGRFSAPTVDVLLERIARHPFSVQQHDYTLFAGHDALRMTGKTLLRATVDTGTDAAPSTLRMTFQATAPETATPCTLTDGTPGLLRQRTGTLSVQAFRFVSGTRPFFATITTPPSTATLAADPGCRPRGFNPNPCPGTETISTVNAPYWIAERVYGTSKVYELVLDVSPRNPAPGSQTLRFLNAALPQGVLPPPNSGAAGATARWLTTGHPYMSGSATFTSTTAPQAHRTQVCTHEGVTHRYNLRRFHGLLRPDASPLTALFDTGALTLPPRRATLDLVSYLS